MIYYSIRRGDHGMVEVYSNGRGEPELVGLFYFMEDALRSYPSAADFNWYDMSEPD